MKYLSYPLLALIIFSSDLIFAQPVNDDCSSATLIGSANLDDGTMSGNCVPLTSQSYVDATPWEVAPGLFFVGNCWGGMIDSVLFYSFVAQGVSGMVEVTGGPGMIPQISVLDFNVTCDVTGAIEIGCAENGPVVFDNQLVVGQTYYVVVAFENSVEGNFDICVSNPPHDTPCFTNDYCDDPAGLSSAEVLPTPTTQAIDDCSGSGNPFVCVDGCNLFADPESANASACHNPNDPVVWYVFDTDADANLLNVSVNSVEMLAPTVSVFFSSTGICGAWNEVACLTGSGGQVVINGIDVGGFQTYFIAVGGVNTFGGEFELCINTIAQITECVVNTQIDIVDRSIGTDLAGPFFPGEEVDICMRVINYDASTNNCQWFQGIVPTFGNGWDLTLFDPINGATLNGQTFPRPALLNGGTWNWWDDVTYHHDHCYYNVGDFNGDGWSDICNGLFDQDCMGPGLMGGCCPSCWTTTPGSLLPPGWFTSGVTGLCGADGHPTVDWGDGINCGFMPQTWNFCFTLTVKEFPDCQDQDLTLGFVTFADGEVGSWQGTSSVCGADPPDFRFLPLCCNDITNRSDVHPPFCAGGVFNWTLDDPGASFYEWTVNAPSSVTGHSSSSGPVGTVILDNLINTGSIPATVTYNILGFLGGDCTSVIWDIAVVVYPQSWGFVLQDELVGAFTNDPIVCQGQDSWTAVAINPIPGATGYLWAGFPWIRGGIHISEFNDMSGPDDPLVIPDDAPAGDLEICVVAFNGCYTTETEQCFTLTIEEIPDEASTEVTLCPEEFVSGIQWGGLVITAPGIYSQAFNTSEGCPFDSIKLFESYPVVTTSIADNICSGDSYTLPDGSTTSTGGIFGPFMFVSANGCDSIVNVTISPLSTVTTPITESLCANQSIVINGITYDSPGSYLDTIVGGAASGCDSILNITINGDTPAIDEIIIINSACGGSNGSITILATGGTPPLTYSIGGPSVLTNIFFGLPSGTYPILITDQNACTVASIIQLLDDGSPDIDITSVTPTTCGANTGTIAMTASGGTGSLLYSIDGGSYSSVSIFTNLTAGSHSVCVKDAQDCFECTEVFIDNDTPGTACDDGNPTTINDVIQENCVCQGMLHGVVITNIISPNGDNMNDVLRFSNDPVIENSELRIFNRWGNEIYHVKEYRNDWDAEGYPGGVYFYVLTIAGVEIKQTLTVLK